jgi:YjbE family integral membrane protein
MPSIQFAKPDMLDFFATLHWGAVLQIVVIDMLLGGDNAVVIALACRKLPNTQRMQGVLWGTVGAIALRVVLIAFAVTLLDVPFLKLVGGLLLLWIGVRLMLPDADGHANVEASDTLWAAVRTIVVADAVMSLDNVIAIAGAAEQADPGHRLALVVFGLVVSVPIIVWGSTLVLKLLDRLPVLVTLGAGLLGWIAGGLMVHDPVGEGWPLLDKPEVGHAASVAGALLVIGVGYALQRMRRASKVA